jgi:hypothetical protein
MKYTVLACVAVSALLFGLKEPDSSRRDPVPDGVIVAHSSHCAGCHGYDPTGLALTDGDGRDINIYDDWRVSMMGFSAIDPFWRATLQHEVGLFPAAQAEIEETCLRCHAPLGSQQRKYMGQGYSFAEMLGDSLGLDGASCAACHQQPPETYGTAHSGYLTLNYDRNLFGPHPDPLEAPMELYVGFNPVYTDLMYSSGICAGCHTLVTGTLDTAGVPTGDFFVEQATYHEWLNSTYAFQGKECQNCHMPLLEDSVILANDLKDLEKRSPFGLHQFHGANTAMLTLIRENRDTLGLPDTISQAAWEESLEENLESLHDAATVTVSDYHLLDDTLVVQVQVMNHAGHKLPTGYPSRVAWLQVILQEDLTGDTIYANGLLRVNGMLEGRDAPFEPHHEIAYSEEDVQIYEMVMSDISGAVTTRLNAAYQPVKDNRILPLGFRRDHAVYDTVAVRGLALVDPDYNELTASGTDRIEYRIPLYGRDGLADLQVSLRYHTFPARWMQDLFTSDHIPDVVRFEKMYRGYETFSELMDSVVIEDLSLDVSNVEDPDASEWVIFPNPAEGNTLYVKKLRYVNYHYELIDLGGVRIQSGILGDAIMLDEGIRSGIYVIVVYDGQNVVRAQKLVYSQIR